MFSYTKTLDSLRPYIPGSYKKGAIKLSSNENPWGVSVKVKKAISNNLDSLNLYPDANCTRLRQELARDLNLDSELFVFGAGSNELIDIIMRIFMSAGGSAISGEYSFAIYRLIALAMGRPIKLVKTIDFKNDIYAIEKTIDKQSSILLIDNPNNPTGTYLNKDEIQYLLKLSEKLNFIILVDEAYHEFVRAKDYSSAINLVHKYKNLIVARTFSKVYGLSSLRIGYIYANSWIVELINKVRPPFNVNSLAQVAAISAINDKNFIEKTIENTHKGIDFLTTNLKNSFEIVPSQTNFITVKPQKTLNLYELLTKENIIIRPLDAYNLKDYYRISIGTMEQNTELIYRLKKHKLL